MYARHNTTPKPFHSIPAILARGATWAALPIVASTALSATPTRAASGNIYGLAPFYGYKGFASYGVAINASGQVTGSIASVNKDLAFLSSGTLGSGGAMVPLDDTLNYSYGLALNASGQVAGAFYTDNSAHAFRYSGTPGHGTLYDLGTLGGTNSWGTAINDFGQVAGHSDTADGNQHAVLCNDEGNPPLDLHTDLQEICCKSSIDKGPTNWTLAYQVQLTTR